MSLFKGSCPALITPFTKDGVNYDTLYKLIDFQIENSSDAILILGTTGEPPTMTKKEKDEIIPAAIDYINKRVPVIIGTGTNSTKMTIENSIAAKKAGANAVLVMSPYYNKATQKGLICHFNAVCDEADVPVMIYNVASRTGININADTMGAICENKNAIAVKEASGNISQIMEISRLIKGKADLYSGNDDHIVPVLSCGGKGVVSVCANAIPKQTHDLVHTFLNGDTQKALEMQHKIDPFIRALFSEVNPIPIKEAVKALGFNVGDVRLPLTPMEENTKAVMFQRMKELNLI